MKTPLGGHFRPTNVNHHRPGNESFSFSFSKMKNWFHFLLPNDSNHPTEHRTLARSTGEVHRQPVSRAHVPGTLNK
jgi:hypothetical protein